MAASRRSDGAAQMHTYTRGCYLLVNCLASTSPCPHAYTNSEVQFTGLLAAQAGIRGNFLCFVCTSLPGAVENRLPTRGCKTNHARGLETQRNRNTELFNEFIYLPGKNHFLKGTRIQGRPFF
jgi:hypothetical protein